MRIAVDAHAIGRHLTGNEVYVRSLLREFAEIDRHSEFVAYISEPGAEQYLLRVRVETDGGRRGVDGRPGVGRGASRVAKRVGGRTCEVPFSPAPNAHP